MCTNKYMLFTRGIYYYKKLGKIYYRLDRLLFSINFSLYIIYIYIVHISHIYKNLVNTQIKKKISP